MVGDNNIKMRFGKFVESNNKGQTKPEKETKGYMVTGQVSDTMNAKTRVKHSVISTEDSENQAKYSRKWQSVPQRLTKDKAEHKNTSVPNLNVL